MTTQTEVLEANDRFYQAFNTKDMELMEAVWANDHAVSCVHPGWNILEGREDVLQSWRNILGNPNQPRIVAGGATATLFDELAVVLCRELVAGSPLTATNLFVLEDGEWRLFHHQSGPVYASNAP